jgi:peptidyl-prolyl cis-trans isomerase SurA
MELLIMPHRAAVLAFAFGASLLASPLYAQSSIATVNGEAITNRDVEQRMKVSGALFRQPLSRAAAIQELIDDKIKINEGRRIGMRMTAAGLDDSMTRLATNARQTPTQFEQNLIRAGIDPEAVKSKITGQAIWTELLRQRARSQNVSNSELNAELERRAAKGEAKVDYVVRQIVFVVPSGSSPGQRERDANGARGRFTDCEAGVEYMRTLRDVAVKERIGRTSTELPKAMNELLGKTPIGRLTPPFRSEQGIEMIAVCEKNDRLDNIQLRNQIEQELLQKRAEGTSATYLNELKAKAEIRR